MSRKRTKDKGLPRRVAIKNGAYRFRPLGKMIDPVDGVAKTWVKLCNVSDGEPAMYASLAKLLGDNALSHESMPYLCDEFKKYKLDEYTEETQKTYRSYCKKIALAFNDFNVAQVKTKDCADFIRHNFKSTPNTAKKYAALLGKIFIYAISELGLRQDNPIDNLDTSHYRTGRREVLITHEQVSSIRAAGFIGLDEKETHSGPMFACLIDMTYLCWQRAIEVRMLRESQIENGYIVFRPTKTKKSSGKQVAIFITKEIGEVLTRARQIKKQYAIISDYVFSKKDCKPYTKDGLYSMWTRAKERAGLTEEDITFRDIRALGATDAAKAGEDPKEIQKRLAHTSAKTTDIYIKEVVPDKSKLTSKLPWNV